MNRDRARTTWVSESHVLPYTTQTADSLSWSDCGAADRGQSHWQCKSPAVLGVRGLRDQGPRRPKPKPIPFHKESHLRPIDREKSHLLTLAGLVPSTETTSLHRHYGHLIFPHASPLPRPFHR